MHQRQFLQREGRGRVPEAAPRPGARQVLPGGGFSFLLPSSCFLRLCSESHFQRIRRNALHFSPRFSQGPDWRRGRGWRRGAAGGTGRRAPGAAATWPPERAPCRWSLVGRPGPRRAESRVSPHPRRGRPPRLPTPWRGGCFSGFKGHGPQRRRRGRLQRLLLRLLHTPGLRASFRGEQGGGRGAGGGTGAR